MSITLKKIIATVTTVTCAAWLMGPAAAGAITAAELQAQINALLAQLSALQSQLSTLEGGTSGTVSGCTITSFDRNLSQGMSGNDVKCLQIVLNSSSDTQVAASGVGSSGNETTYFGSLTKAAVIKFQEKYASEVLATYGLTSGTGYVGTTTRAKLNTMLVAGEEEEEEEEEEPVAGAGENKISLTADTPAAATVAKGAQNVIFAKINFCAASAANTVSKIILTRSGIAEDADISYVKLYEGTTQLGSTQALNSSTHKATFAALNWTIAANSCKVLTVKASIAAGATQGDTPKLSIASTSDITSTVALDGVFPIESKGMTIAGLSTGWVEVSTSTSPSGSVIAGATVQPIADFKFTASSTEGVKIYAVKVTEVGSSVDADIANIKLFYQSAQLGSTVAALANGAAEFDLSAAPLEILASSSKTLSVYADIGTGTGIKDRNIKFEITANTDVTAYGSNSGGSVTAYGNTQATDQWPLQGQQIDIDLGSLVVSQDTTYSPSAQSYSRGTEQNSIVAFKFSAGAYEGVRVTQIKLQEAVASTSDSDVNNVTLYDAETGEVIAGPAGVVSGYVTFGSYTTGLDATGLFDIVKSKNRIILVKADISSAAAISPDQVGFQITNSQTDVKADGLESANDLGTDEITPSSALGNTLYHTVLEKGTLTVGPNSDTPSAATYSVGTENITFAKFDLISTGEDILVSQLNVYFGTGTSDTASDTAADAADVNNIELWDGSTLLKSDPTISSGKAEFAINLTVPKNTTKTLTVKGDVPTGSDADGLQAWIASNSDITAEGKSSAVAITAAASSWDTVNGNVMTKGDPGIAIVAATTPASKTFIKNTSGAHVATIYFTASSTENVKITRIKIAATAATNSSSSVANGRAAFNLAQETDIGLDVEDVIGNVKIYDGSTQVGSTVPTLTDGTYFDYANFTGLSLVISKGTTKAIDVKVDINNSTTTTGDDAVYYYFGVASGTEDVAGTGIDSGTALTSTTITINADGEPGSGMLFGDAGTLAVITDVDTAISAEQVASNQKVTLGSWKFTATNENINITKLTFDANNSAVASGTSVGYAGGITALEADLTTSTTAYAFEYTLDGAATSECYVYWDASNTDADATTTDNLAAVFASTASTSCATDIAFSTSSTSIVLTASSTLLGQSLQIMSATGTDLAETLKLGAVYGGTESIGRYAGANANIGALYLYDGSTLLATSYVGANLADKVVFETSDSSPFVIPIGNKVLTLKADVSAYTALLEGSTVYFSIGSASASTDPTYVTAKGASSGTALTDGSIIMDAKKSANEMWLYATKPTVSLNASSPSGSKTVSSMQEVFKFDVANTPTSLDLTINAIRFSVSSDATGTWGNTFNLYKSTDPSTIIGTAVAYANASTTETTGWVTIFPAAGNQIGSGNTTTYILKGDTRDMNITTGSDNLTISIEDGDFYWDDGLTVNANQKVLNLPVTGNTLQY